jgi:hypothetical protein
VSIANVRDVRPAIEAGARSNDNQRALGIVGGYRHLDEAQGEGAAIEAMASSATTLRARSVGLVVIAIQRPPCRNQLIDHDFGQGVLFMAEQSGDRAIARRDASFSIDEQRCRWPMRQWQANDRRSQRILFPSLVVTVPAWRLLPRLATAAFRPNGFHWSPLRVMVE